MISLLFLDLIGELTTALPSVERVHALKRSPVLQSVQRVHALKRSAVLDEPVSPQFHLWTGE
jgi:hypothetical protein